MDNLKTDTNTPNCRSQHQRFVSCRAVPEGCYEDGDCKWIDEEGIWCKKMDAPADFNPVLRLCGMACMGFGHEKTID